MSASRRVNRVLVVDDNRLHLAITRACLEVEGYVVDTFEDAVTAFYSWCQHHHTLVLTDLDMPGTNGLGLAAQLRRVQGDRSLGVFVITANPSHGELFTSRIIDGALKKPITPDDVAWLTSWCEAVLDRRPPMVS